MVPPPIALHLALKYWARNMMPVCGEEPRRRLRRSARGPELNSLSMCTHACTQLHSLKLFEARGIGVRGQELPQFQRASVVQKQVLAGKTCARLNTTARFWANIPRINSLGYSFWQFGPPSTVAHFSWPCCSLCL